MSTTTVCSSVVLQVTKSLCFSSFRDIAQLGRALALGAGRRRFKSCYPDGLVYILRFFLTYNQYVVSNIFWVTF